MAMSSCRVNRDEVLRASESAGLEYVLIGATAMGFHGVVRATEDLDLLGEYPAMRYYPPTGDLYDARHPDPPRVRS
jgi:predicted nucleotidyltransferase